MFLNTVVCFNLLEKFRRSFPGNNEESRDGFQLSDDVPEDVILHDHGDPGGLAGHDLHELDGI